MSIERSRIEKLEAVARMRPAGPKTAAEMTDGELLLACTKDWLAAATDEAVEEFGRIMEALNETTVCDEGLWARLEAIGAVDHINESARKYGWAEKMGAGPAT